MDFTKLSKWSDRARNFHEFLGDILEGERELVSDPAVNRGAQVAAFSVRNDLEHTAGRLAREPKLSARFAGLAPFFEAGFLLENAGKGESSLRSMFLFGQVFSSSEREQRAENRITLGLPERGFDGVLRGHVMPLLRAFRLERLNRLHYATVFAISPKSGCVALLICNRPHPWQVGMLEQTYEIFHPNGPT